MFSRVIVGGSAAALLALIVFVAIAQHSQDVAALHATEASVATQNSYAHDRWDDLPGLLPPEVTTSVWFMSGFALHANNCQPNTGGAIDGVCIVPESVERFVSYSKGEIENRLSNYLGNHPELDPLTTDLIVLDMEKPVHPRHIGQYPVSDHAGVDQREIIEAFKIRTEVAREMLPNAALSLYGVIVPDPQARNSDAFHESWRGYVRAGAMGMYDHVDFLSPVLYVRWGPSDGSKYDTIDAYTRMGVELTRRLPRVKPLVPLLNLRVSNGNSNHDSEFVSFDVARAQLDYLRSLPDSVVRRIVYWAPPSEDHDKYSTPGEIGAFLSCLSGVGGCDVIWPP